MPLPWKKTKGTRISQLVADHINSSKHGGSLVVQTGFPTSLIDLFHKNRDRLKKPTKKKRPSSRDPVSVSLPVTITSSLDQQNTLNYSNPGSEVVGSQDCLTKSVKSESCSTKVLNEGDCSSNRSVDVEVSGKDSVRKVIYVVSGKDGVDKVIEDGHKFFVVVLKILCIILLGLLAKRMVVGVSMSAVFLFFLEYVYELLKPCANCEKLLKMIVERVSCIISGEGNNLKREYIESDSCGLTEGHRFYVPSADMQIVQVESNLEPQIEQIIELDCIEGLKYEKMDSKEVLVKEGDCKCETKQNGSRRGKIGSKMKKFVPKKFCKSRKKGSGSNSELPQKEVKRKDKELDKDDKKFECNERLCENEIESNFDTTDPCEVPHNDPEANVVSKAKRETDGTLGYGILCLMILSGLVGGRFLAIVFTLSWCLMFRPVENKAIPIRPQMLRSSSEISG